ncbi:MAG TPA: hypothetical protein PLD10_16960 [Rhodopila sp.]|nr:hypothetical protein [Rhodopila sp.]
MIAPGWKEGEALGGQIPRQGAACRRTPGSCLANPFGVRLDAGIPAMSSFAGLDAADRQVLAEWLARKSPDGVDAVLDLTARPWNLAGACVIIGVFEPARPLATWLILRHPDGWLLIRPGDGFVSDLCATLTGVLASIGRSGPQ